MKHLTLVLLFICFNLSAQENPQSELFKTLKQKDSLIFEVGFNNCDASVYPTLVADDLEFYHDQGGITNSREAFVQTFKKNICGNPNFKSRRELVENSLEVFPMYSNGNLYGALQTGVHKFYESFNGKPEVAGSTARFAHLWLLENGAWTLKRVISYDHISP